MFTKCVHVADVNLLRSQNLATYEETNTRGKGDLRSDFLHQRFGPLFTSEGSNTGMQELEQQEFPVLIEVKNIPMPQAVQS